MKRGAVIKDNNGRLITESKEPVLRIWAAYFKELLKEKGAASSIELPISVGREVYVEGV